MKKVVLTSFLFCFVFSLNAHAEDIWQMANSKQYGKKAGGMFTRGLLNVATSPIDMPVQAVNGARDRKPSFVGAVSGFASGAVCTVLRATSGVIDVATFWVPDFHGLPVARSYDNCLNAEAHVPAPVMRKAPPARKYVPPPAPVKKAPPRRAPAPKVVEAKAPPAPAADNRSKYIKK